jgi:hypothetical protein
MKPWNGPHVIAVLSATYAVQDLLPRLWEVMRTAMPKSSTRTVHCKTLLARLPRAFV